MSLLPPVLQPRLTVYDVQAERQASVRIIAADGQSAQPLASYASQASCPPRQLTHGCVISVCDVYYRLELPTVRPGPEMALLC